MRSTPDAILAEFDGVAPVLAAIERLQAQGITGIDVYTPYPVAAIERALSIRRSRIPFAAFGAAVLGGGAAYLLQYWTAARDYVLDVGGRPPHMVPAFIPITFEMAVLSCAFTAFVAVFVRAGLPRLWHPLFEVDGFDRVSVDRFFLALDRRQPVTSAEIAQVLLEAGALRVVGDA